MTRPLRLLALVPLLLAACGQKNPSETAATTTAEAAPVRAAPAPSGGWNQVATLTPGYGVRVGNPNAKVQFIEFASVTCPHCRDFSKESRDALHQYIATGKVAYEYRPFPIHGQDAAISIAMLCLPPRAFARSIDQFYDDQDQIIKNYMGLTQADQDRINALPRDKVLIAVADAGKLYDFLKVRGMSRAQYEKCLSDPANVSKLQASANEAVNKYGLSATPTFVINGQPRTDLTNWSDVNAALKQMSS